MIILEKLVNYRYTLDIQEIYNICGDNRKFEVMFISKTDGCRYKLIFDDVFDMRYSIENGFIGRFYQFKKNLPKKIKVNSIYVVKKSEYIKFFHEQSDHTLETASLKDYIVCDEIDTVLEILSSEDPVLIKL